MTLKIRRSAYTSIYTMYTNDDFGIGVGGWMEVIKISIVS